MEIKRVRDDDVKEVAQFITKLNNVEESHIGFCGTNSDEVVQALKNDLTDIPFTDSFVVAYEQDCIIGVIGFDGDLDGKIAEVWGPFILENKWHMASSLWDSLVELLPSEIDALHLFPNKKNVKVLQLAEEHNFQKNSEQAILDFPRSRIKELKDVAVVELTPVFYKDMMELHDEVFPSTYYNGQQIVDRLNEERKVFIIEEHGELAGYIYVEAVPEFGEGTIEFFAVKNSKRGQGVGVQLLSTALQWLFTFDSMDSVRLCVNANNKAIRLYKKVGFQHIHDLCYFTKRYKVEPKRGKRT